VTALISDGLQTLLSLAAERCIPLSDTLGVGDGAWRCCALPVWAWRSVPSRSSQPRRTRVDHGTLRAVLFAARVSGG